MNFEQNYPQFPTNSAEFRNHPVLQSLQHRTAKMLFLRGIVGVVVGLLLLFVPVITAATLGIFIAIALAFWLLIDGAGMINVALQYKKAGLPKWGWLMGSGIVALLVAIGIVISPVSFAAAGSLFILWMFAFGLILQGLGQIADRQLGSSSVALGTIKVIFGIGIAILLVANPASTLVAMIWVAGTYTVVFGLIALYIAWKIRSARQ